MALRRAARAEARRHPAGSNAPPARIRFGTIPPEEFRKRLREAGWWYDWITAVWNLPEDPDRWPAADALVAEAEVSGIPLERLAPGPGIEGLDAPPAPPPSLWRRKSGRKGRSGGSFKASMRTDQARQVSDLKGLTPKEARDWKWEDELRSLHVWARAADVETHQLAAWQPHALARLRDRLVAELAPKVRAEVVARMSPWGSPSWQRGYNRRNALERINSRIDRVHGMESHFVRGRAKDGASLQPDRRGDDGDGAWTRPGRASGDDALPCQGARPEGRLRPEPDSMETVPDPTPGDAARAGIRP